MSSAAVPIQQNVFRKYCCFFFKLAYNLFCRSYFIIVWWGLRLARAVSGNVCPISLKLRHCQRFGSLKLLSYMISKNKNFLLSNETLNGMVIDNGLQASFPNGYIRFLKALCRFFLSCCSSWCLYRLQQTLI